MPYPGGIYTVISELPDSQEIQFGKCNNCFFEKGFYVYVGSAMNGLEKRLERHLGNRKRMHWHIDYLLESAVVKDAILSETTENLECSIAHSLSGTLSSIPGFGCSDCRCSSHLFYSQDMPTIVNKVIDGFSKHGLEICRMAPDYSG